MPDDVSLIKSFARLQKAEELLPWANRLINDLFLQFIAIAKTINDLNDMMGGGGGPSHALLSATHTDTVPGTPPARGDFIVGNSALLWEKFAIGASGRFLRSNGTDPAWSTIARGDLPTEIAYEDETNTFSLAQVLQSYLEYVSISTPGDPNPGSVFTYTNKTGDTVEFRIRFEDGSECIVCTHTLALGMDELPLNWVE